MACSKRAGLVSIGQWVEPRQPGAQPIVQLKPDPHAWSRPSGEFRKPKLGFTAPFLLEPGVTTPDCGFCHRVPQSRCFASLPCILSPRLDLLCALEGLARRPPPGRYPDTLAPARLGPPH